MFFLLIGYSNTRVLLCKKYVFFYFAMMMQFLFSRTFSLRFSIATVTEAEAGERASEKERASERVLLRETRKT
jgi:hypothetical protein